MPRPSRWLGACPIRTASPWQCGLCDRPSDRPPEAKLPRSCDGAARAIAGARLPDDERRWNVLLGVGDGGWRRTRAGNRFDEQGSRALFGCPPSQRPYMLAVLASAKADLGKADEGLELLKDALASTEASGERWWQAELHRLRGSCLWTQGSMKKAKPVFGWQSRSAAGRELGRLSFVLQQASHGFGATEARTPKPMISSPRSTDGSPRVSARPT